MGLGERRLQDARYLQDVQYADGARLAARAGLHARFGRGDWSWWLAGQVPWPSAGRVLEVGCGTGQLWVEAGEVVPAATVLTLTDLSPGMVDEAVGRVGALGRFAEVVGRRADVADLPDADGAFDLALASFVLQHVPDPGRAVAELARVLVDDGALVVAAFGPLHLRELFELRREAFGSELVDRDRFGADGLEAEAARLRASFAEVALVRYEDRLRVDDPGAVLAYLCSTPPGDGATDAQLGVLAAAVDRRFSAEGGVLEVTKDCGCLVCRSPRR